MEKLGKIYMYCYYHYQLTTEIKAFIQVYLKPTNFFPCYRYIVIIFAVYFCTLQTV